MVLDTRDRPNRLPWPPMIYATALGAGLVLDRLAPISFPSLAAVGAAVVAAGLTLDGAAMITMARFRTTILPHRGAGRLVTHGPFALSRNPIYLGNTLLLAGFGLLLGSGWLLVAAPVAAYATQRLAILREEAHLAVRFGSEWEAYAARVPRWIRIARRAPG